MSGPSPATHLKHSTQVLQLGYAGLLPFVAGALLVWLLREPAGAQAAEGQAVMAHSLVAQALAAYAAVIASFLGGIHWGLALREPAPPLAWLAWGVTPSLLAWVAVLLPPGPGLVLLALLLLACYGVDRRLYPVQGLARWLPLRLRLSAVAAVACAMGAAGVWSG
jgi:hypothetical protein